MRTLKALESNAENMRQPEMDHVCGLVRKGQLKVAITTLAKWRNGDEFTREEAERLIKHWDAQFGHRKIDDQTEELIHAFRQKRAKKGDYDRDTLWAMFERLCAIGYLPKYDPNQPISKWVDEDGNPR